MREIVFYIEEDGTKELPLMQSEYNDLRRGEQFLKLGIKIPMRTDATHSSKPATVFYARHN